MVSPHVIIDYQTNVFEILLTDEESTVQGIQNDDLGEVTGAVSQEEKVVAEIWERSAAVDRALWYTCYLYWEPASSALTYEALYIELTILDTIPT